MADTPDTPNATEIPADQIWITTLIARGIARTDEAALAFHAGGEPGALDVDRDLRQEYMEEAYDILRGTGRIDELALMEKLVQGPSEKPKKKMTIDEIEAWIADREAKVSRIEHHLHIWDRGGFEGRDKGWADRARKAVDFTERQIRFGYNARLSMTRETLVPALDARIGQLETAREADRDRRTHLVDRREAETKALKVFLRERAPHLLKEAYAVCDAAVSAFDRAGEQTRAPEPAEPEPDMADPSP